MSLSIIESFPVVVQKYEDVSLYSQKKISSKKKIQT